MLNFNKNEKVQSIQNSPAFIAAMQNTDLSYRTYGKNAISVGDRFNIVDMQVRTGTFEDNVTRSWLEFVTDGAPLSLSTIYSAVNIPEDAPDEQIIMPGLTEEDVKDLNITPTIRVPHAWASNGFPMTNNQTIVNDTLILIAEKTYKAESDPTGRRKFEQKVRFFAPLTETMRVIKQRKSENIKNNAENVGE